MAKTIIVAIPILVLGSKCIIVEEKVDSECMLILHPWYNLDYEIDLFAICLKFCTKLLHVQNSVHLRWKHLMIANSSQCLGIDNIEMGSRKYGALGELAQKPSDHRKIIIVHL